MRAWQLGRGPAAYASRLTNPVIRRLQIRYGVARGEGEVRCVDTNGGSDEVKLPSSHDAQDTYARAYASKLNSSKISFRRDRART